MVIENATQLFLIQLLQFAPLLTVMMVAVCFKPNQTFKYDGYLRDMLEQASLVPTKYNGSIVGLIDGKSGLGKTTLSLQVAYLWNKTKVHIYYDPMEFLKGLAKATPLSVHIFDEAMIVSNRSALSAVNRMIIQAMSMIRSKRIYCLFNVNSCWDIDRNLVLSRADFLLHVYGSPTNRGKFCAFFKGADDKKDRLKELYLYGKKTYSYARPKANFYGSFPKAFLIDDDQYEADKQKAINKFMESDAGNNMGKREEGYKKLVARLLWLGRKDYKMNYVEVADKLDIDKKMLSRTVVWARDEGHLEYLEGKKH